MSRRNRRLENNGGPRKDERLAEHRRDRRTARQKIDVADADAVVLPGEGPAHLHSHRPTSLEKRRPRQWKLPFWKRRGAVRAEKARAERRMADEV